MDVKASVAIAHVDPCEYRPAFDAKQSKLFQVVDSIRNFGLTKHSSDPRRQGETVAKGLMAIHHALIFSSIAVDGSCNFLFLFDSYQQQ